MKFKLTSNTKLYCGTTLYQIQATASFGNVKEWDLGWWIEKESNLSQEGDSWVSGNALVFGDAWVFGNALVFGDALVFGSAWVYGNALVFGKFKINTGLLFGRKDKDWNVTEVENEWTILLIKDYKPVQE